MNNAFHPSREEIEALMGLAEENLRLAHLEFEHGFSRAVVSKAYFVFRTWRVRPY